MRPVMPGLKRCKTMNHCALHAISFMMAFVLVFDELHSRHRLIRSIHLFSSDELSRLQAIWAACQDN